MRRVAGLFGVLSLLLVPAAGRSQGVPGTITLTARILENGMPATGTHALKAKLFDAETGGTPVWEEPQATVVIRDGLLFHELGLEEALDSTIFTGAKLYLELAIDTVTTSPRLAIQSVPYAIRAGVAETAETAETLGAHLPDDFVTGVAPGAGLTGGGSTGDVTLGVTFAGRGSATTVARSDHDHPDYLTDITTAETSGVAVTNGAGPSPAIGLMSCAAGNILKSTGAGTWACASDDNAGGDLTALQEALGGGIDVTNEYGPIPTVGLISCTVGEMLVSVPGGWTCTEGGFYTRGQVDGFLTTQSLAATNDFVNVTGDTVNGSLGVMGSVGIGTATPGGKLEINYDPVDAPWNRWAFEERGFVGLTGVRNLALTVPAAYGDGGGVNRDRGYLDILKTNNTNTILATRSTDAAPLGYVGVGTMTPAAPLDVRRVEGGEYGLYEVARFHVDNGGAGDRGLAIVAPTSGMNAVGLKRVGTGANFVLRNDSDVTQFALTDDGRVGIGTGETTPATRLHVKGDILAEGSVNGGMYLGMYAFNRDVQETLRIRHTMAQMIAQGTGYNNVYALPFTIRLVGTQSDGNFFHQLVVTGVYRYNPSTGYERSGQFSIDAMSSRAYENNIWFNFSLDSVEAPERDMLAIKVTSHPSLPT